MSKLDFIVLAVPLFSLPRLLETIEKTIYVRKPPKGKNPYCAMILNEGGGGISKSFNTVRELALHIYDTFGDYWASSVRCKDTAPRPAATPAPASASATSTPLQTNKSPKKVKRTQGGNCLFRALARALPNATNHRQVRSDIAAFYAEATDQQIEAMSRRYHERNLRDRAAIIEEVGVWGEGVDIGAFASTYDIGITAVIVTSPNSGETGTINFYPIDAAGDIDRQCQMSTSTLHFNGIDHWSLI